MKSKHRPKNPKQPNLAIPTILPNVAWPREKDFAEEPTANTLSNKTAPHKEQVIADKEMLPACLKAFVSIATNAWRAKIKMVDAEQMLAVATDKFREKPFTEATEKVHEKIKRGDRHIEAIYRNLEEVGVVIRDHTGDAYDEGQPMKVIASKPTAGLDKKRVSETLLPSIFWNNRLVQNGEIEIATPASPNTSAESQPHEP